MPAVSNPNEPYCGLPATAAWAVAGAAGSESTAAPASAVDAKANASIRTIFQSPPCDSPIVGQGTPLSVKTNRRAVGRQLRTGVECSVGAPPLAPAAAR